MTIFDTSGSPSINCDVLYTMRIPLSEPVHKWPCLSIAIVLTDGDGMFSSG